MKYSYKLEVEVVGVVEGVEVGEVGAWGRFGGVEGECEGPESVGVA